MGGINGPDLGAGLERVTATTAREAADRFARHPAEFLAIPWGLRARVQALIDHARATTPVAIGPRPSAAFPAVDPARDLPAAVALIRRDVERHHPYDAVLLGMAADVLEATTPGDDRGRERPELRALRENLAAGRAALAAPAETEARDAVEIVRLALDESIAEFVNARQDAEGFDADPREAARVAVGALQAAGLLAATPPAPEGEAGPCVIRTREDFEQVAEGVPMVPCTGYGTPLLDHVVVEVRSYGGEWEVAQHDAPLLVIGPASAPAPGEGAGETAGGEHAAVDGARPFREQTAGEAGLTDGTRVLRVGDVVHDAAELDALPPFTAVRMLGGPVWLAEKVPVGGPWLLPGDDGDTTSEVLVGSGGVRIVDLLPQDGED